MKEMKQAGLKRYRTLQRAYPECKRQIKDGYFLDRLLGIIPLFKEAFSWNQSSLQSISVSISPK
ncbi:hypothetical protein, partial [Allobaculum fili]|uniref:hypothetical protein n=1 Tax=Allobaculum fili TaxID=2834460 RepID=UPI001E5919DB